MEPARAITEEALHAGLRDIHLPLNAPGGLVAELFAALALGLALALILGLLLRTLTARRAGMPAEAPLDALPDEARRLALLRLLRERAPERYAEIAASLYRPGGLPEAAELQAELDRHA
ncbi:hypothetical protein [Roseivivax sediminis]|uniref:Uncharacterized protein n=1 Tax=Roseivivax sediminis TaxID=936889 RepID=A0A1I1TX57_9RHOB|nr:hypothetical protein [Roseivivax sediminis]SFD63191.1 hypothetical protein SAMN04515678_10225 [Roseivivax sediminis]